MLDELLGRKALKERIDELEETNDHLQRQLDAEQDRRADAVTDRQQAQRRVNELEDRIEGLQERVDRLQSSEGDLEFRRRERLHGERLDAILSRLESFQTGPEGVLTAFVPDGHDVPAELQATLGDHTGLVARAAPCLAVTDDAGLLAATLSVPIEPDPFVTWAGSVTIERSWFQPTGQFTVALVRSDLFAMGEFEGRERIAFHGFDSDLSTNHSKGGFSQARFERLRDEQIDDHVERSRAVLEERSTDRLIVLGEQSVLPSFEDVADVTATVSATGKPEPALDDAVREFWTVTYGGI
jgi:peptide subunit release factor 1 (eRF1)